MTSSLDPARTAVLALHWQIHVVKPEGFFGGMLAEPVARSGVVDNAVRFHESAHAAGATVFHTRFTVPEDGGLMVPNTEFMRSVAEAGESFRPDAEMTRIIPEMAESADHVVDNQKLSGLAGNDLTETLRTKGIDTVLVTGVATNLTVEQTARHATDLGFITHVISDCVTTTDETTHQASLSNLDMTTAGCRTAADTLAGLAVGVSQSH
ncbi:isochorismatase family protein [Allosaccharopolyspora coralli]|uniref:Isochorismatase family protein n=1 Tax=Allosaccharopolyspora coralli TaxID=2665642 RepID=A0A5Q3Q9U1_9PSEU|nr:cysteine hydrolase [Allosaccharopolyspora coralli]QGK70620.1 isochorismatase family protein [Allosaccharopolyspora coralli]